MLPARKIIGANIKTLARERDMSLDELAERAGVSRRVLGKVTAGRENYRIDILESIARSLRVAASNLLTDPDAESTVTTTHKPRRPGTVLIPHLDVQASAGNGATPIDRPAVLEEIEVSEIWLRQVLGVTPNAAVHVIDARGDSMSGTINHGDIVFVDVDQKTFESEGIYTLIWNGQLLIKRLRVSGDDRIAIHSDNSAYPPEYVDQRSVDQLTICGRVVGWWTLRRY